MKDALITLLSTFGFLVFEQGTLNPDDDYPESFFTFWNPAADGVSFYDNDEHQIEWRFELNFYSSDPELVNIKLLQAKHLLKQNGWIASGAGHDVASDEITHTGRGMPVMYVQKII